MVQDAALIVGDRDPAVRRLLGQRFRHEGFDVYEFDDPRRLADKIESTGAQLILVELGGGLDFEPLVLIREAAPIPVIGLLWAEPDADEASALDLGADDCLRRPFSVRHLVARTRAVLRRTIPMAEVRLRFPGLTIDRASRTVRVADREVDLAAREFDLLAFLASHPGVAFTRETLLTEVWRSSATWQHRETVTE
ncbi:MAG TPA: response regulator transcription factor, partial [Acidimicrobiales bacterium]|nr:response regulator transcription factor [Acidimicrobiales bacterium]